MDGKDDLEQLSEQRWANLPADVRNEVGEWGLLGTLRLRGPWLVRDRKGMPEILLPAPSDLALILGKSGEVERVVRYLPAPLAGVQGWSHSLALLHPNIRIDGQWAPFRNEKGSAPQSANGWFVTLEGLAKWLQWSTPDPTTLVRSSDLWLTEQRTGVGIQSDRRTAEDGMLYTFGFVRLQRGVAIGFEISGSKIEPGVTATLGGEGRLVKLSRGPSLSESLETAKHVSKMKALYLATPAVFDGQLASQPPGLPIRAAAVSSMIHAGGWDLAKRMPKPLRRAVPAGSVYYTDADDVASFMKISEGHEEGFGVVLAGVC